MITLPAPSLTGNIAVESALNLRRSVRFFTPEPLSLTEVSQLLWAAQGITGFYGQRNAPSAGALYPLDLYLAAGRVEGLHAGVYRYQVQNHSLVLQVEGDARKGLADAALKQRSILLAPAVIVVTAVFDRTGWKYGARAERYVFMETGHTAQNISLQAVALGLGTVMIGAFDEPQVSRALAMEPDEEPLYIIPVGRGRDE
jgi:SagB-type dehydrogenase family enzyme